MRQKPLDRLVVPLAPRLDQLGGDPRGGGPAGASSWACLEPVAGWPATAGAHWFEVEPEAGQGAHHEASGGDLSFEQRVVPHAGARLNHEPIAVDTFGQLGRPISSRTGLEQGFQAGWVVEGVSFDNAGP